MMAGLISYYQGNNTNPHYAIQRDWIIAVILEFDWRLRRCCGRHHHFLRGIC